MIEKLLALITPDAVDRRDPSSEEHFPQGAYVAHLYSDGEITNQKAGRLFGRRSVHCLVPGVGRVIPELHQRLLDLGGRTVHISGVEYAVIQFLVRDRDTRIDEAIDNVAGRGPSFRRQLNAAFEEQRLRAAGLRQEGTDASAPDNPIVIEHGKTRLTLFPSPAT